MRRGADLRPAPAQGGAPLRHAAGGRVERARPRSTAAPTERLRFAPGAAEALLRALQKALLELESGARRRNGADDGDGRRSDGGRSTARPGGARRLPRRALRSTASRRRAEVDVADLRDAAALLTQAENVVVVWGERLGHGERGAGALRGARRPRAACSGSTRAEGSGLIEIPAATNGRGLREIGCLPGLGPGLVRHAAPG